MIGKATLEKNYVTLISRRSISHSQMTPTNPNMVLTRIPETAELFSMLNRGVGSHPSTYCPFLVQSQVLLATFATRPHWWLMFHQGSTIAPGSLLQNYLSVLSLYVSVLGFFFQGWDLAFLFVKIHKVPVRPALLPKSFWMVVQLYSVSFITSKFLSSAKCHSVPSRLLKEMLNSTGHSIDPLGATSVIGLFNSLHPPLI